MTFATTAAEVTARTDRAIRDVEQELAQVKEASDLTWDTVMAPLDEIADLLSLAFGEAAFLGYVHPDAEVRDAGRASEQRLEQWAADMAFDEGLHRAVTAYAATDDAAALTGARSRLLEHTLRDLRRAGHELSPEARAEVREHTARLVEIGVQFANNIADHEDALVVTAEDLDGLPDGYVDQLRPGDEDGTYRVTLAYPDAFPFFEHARRRDLREDLLRRYDNQAVEANRPLLREAVERRHRIATIFGAPSWAHHRMEVLMAPDPSAVHELYDGIVPALTTAARGDLAVMQDMLRNDTGDADATLQAWDWRYYHARRQEQAGVDAQVVAAHFPMERVVDGLLSITGDVFGLDYEPETAEVWHDDVQTLAVHDRASGERLARVHMDLFPREGKFTHAAAFPLVQGRRRPDGSWQQPVAAIVANFTPPSGDRPSLLTHNEVETFFHEFGHILHAVLTTVGLVRFAGIGVERDFAEAPSQIMEHWTWDADVLQRFARHHETGEVIPSTLVDAMVAARNIDVALLKLRQVQFGVLDLLLHGEGADDLDLDEVHRTAAAYMLLPVQEGTFYPASFGHLLGGYDAAYYGYLWAEVYGDDMFSRFAEEGVLSPAVGADYRREILEPGGTRDAIDLVEAFLGRPSNNEAFLRKLGVETGS